MCIRDRYKINLRKHRGSRVRKLLMDGENVTDLAVTIDSRENTQSYEISLFKMADLQAGDEVNITYTPMGVNVDTRITSIEYDPFYRYTCLLYTSLPRCSAGSASFGCGGRFSQRTPTHFSAPAAILRFSASAPVSYTHLDVYKRQLQIFCDCGYSGCNTDRPEYQKMLAAIRTDQVSNVVVLNLSRLNRSYENQHQLLLELEKHNVVLLSLIHS